MPSVSVLVTVYNREAFLEETLKSILGSTFTNYEVIVVDDYSSDDSLSIAKRIAEEDNRVRVFCNKKNLGDYGNRAKAASLAQGKYIKYVDSDDLIYPHSLAIMVESMEKYPDAALALSHSMPDDESPYPWCLSSKAAYRKHFLGRGCISCGPTGAIIKREAFEALEGFNKSWDILSDIDLWLRLSAQWPLVLLPPSLVWWRRHGEQEFTKNDAETVYLRRGYELDMEALMNTDCPLSLCNRDEAIARRRQHFARRLISLAFRKHELQLAQRIYSESNITLVDLIKGFAPYQ